MRSWCRGALALLSLSLLAADKKPPQPALPTLGETIEVSIVNVDVFVTDKQGNRVHGLTKDDFEVFENGVRQPLTNFAEYVGTATPQPQNGAAPAAAPPPDQRRNLVLFVERFRLPKVKVDPIFASMKTMLRDTVRSGDAATVVTWDHGKLETLQPYTDDLALLEGAIDKIARQSTAMMHDEFEEARSEADDVEDFELAAQRFADSVGAGNVVPLLKEGAEEMKPMNARTNALRARADLELKVRSVNALIRSMAGLDGKRVLLLATHRLSKTAGAEFFWAAGVENEGLDGLDRMELDTSAMLDSLAQTANANGVTIYPMFPEGVGAEASPTKITGRYQRSASAGYDRLIESNEIPALKEIAARTGGTPAWGTGDVANTLTAMREDFENYYSLAYRTTPRSLDKARTIEVRAKDSNYRVRSRREVIEKSDVTRMEDNVLASLFRTPSGARLAFAAQIGAPRPANQRLPVRLRIPIASLTTLPNGPNQSGGFSVYIAWGSKIGGISEATHRRQLFHIPNEDIERARKSYYTYDFEIEAGPQTERISIGLVDEVSREYGLRVFRLRPDAQANLLPR